MRLGRIKKRRVKLEHKIADMISKFQNVTGTIICNIELENIEVTTLQGDEKDYIPIIQINIQIP